MMTLPTLVFDLDGTLVETAPDLVQTLNIILAQEGCAPLSYEDARKLIGFGARALLQRGFEAQERVIEPDHMDALFARFIRHYEAHIADRSLVFPYVRESLELMRDQGYTLAVCTNKLEYLARRLLEEMQIDNYFSAICGSDSFAFKKPDPRCLLATIAQAGGMGSHAVMVGDSITDSQTAQAANIPVLLVDFGYSDVPIAQLGADAVMSCWSDLPEKIKKLQSQLDGSGKQPYTAH